MNRNLFYYTLLCIVTFAGVAPYFCVSLVYSVYFVERNVDAEAVVARSNEHRMRLAQAHLNAIKDPSGYQNNHRERLNNRDLDLTIVVKTVDRTTTNSNPYTGYLTQSVTALDRELISNRPDEDDANLFKQVGLIVCNADPNPSQYDEARTLARFYPSVERWSLSRPRASDRSSILLNHRDREKDDYAFCLHAALNYTRAKYILIVEDDAEPYEGFLASLSYVLNYRVLTKMVAGESVRNERKWAYLRLYFPEKWAGYAWEFRPMCELICIAAIAGSIFASIWYRGSICCHKRAAFDVSTGRVYCWYHFAFGAAYVVIILMAIGRQHLMQIRRLLPSFLMVIDPAYQCCTPAVVYPAQVAEEIVRYLANVTCSNSFGVDLALDRFAEERSYQRFVIQPNLVHHRGAYSTLTKPKIFKEFLFDS